MADSTTFNGYEGCPPPLNVNFALVGNADAAKSTLISVLCNRVLDDGDGLARSLNPALQHEQVSGRTSSVKVVRLTDELGLIDLAGQEVYLRITIRGLTAYFPKVALLVVAANRGLTRIDRAHFTICSVLKIPIIMVVTKIDLAPPETKAATLAQLADLCKQRAKTSADTHDKFFIYKVNTVADSEKILAMYLEKSAHIYPLFQVSNKTGENIDLLRDFLIRLSREPGTLYTPDVVFDRFIQERSIQKIFFTFRSYQVQGVGWVVHGQNRGSPIREKDRLFLGPYGGLYHQVVVRSIHSEIREKVDVLEHGASGCLAIRTVGHKFTLTKNSFNKGKILLDRACSFRQARLDIRVCGFQATVTPGYSPFFHSGHVAVNCKIVDAQKKEAGRDVAGPMIHGDYGSVIVEFSTPQFISCGSLCLIRDGSIKMIGVVTDVSAEGFIKYDPRQNHKFLPAAAALPLDEEKLLARYQTSHAADYYRSFNEPQPE